MQHNEIRTQIVSNEWLSNEIAYNDKTETFNSGKSCVESAYRKKFTINIIVSEAKMGKAKRLQTHMNQ